MMPDILELFFFSLAGGFAFGVFHKEVIEPVLNKIDDLLGPGYIVSSSTEKEMREFVESKGLVYNPNVRVAE